MSFQKSSSTLHSRLHLGEIHPALLVGIIVIAVVILSFALFSLSNSQTFAVSKTDTEQIEESESGQGESSDELSQSIEENTPVVSTICVHVGGCVINPGVYYLDENSRVVDAINAAGGFAEDAARDAINLARLLTDGEQVIVLNNEQVQSDASAATATEPSQAQSNDTQEAQSRLININTADSTQLQTLNGIGEATAAKIIAYREENGAFSSIEDIKLVSGIGDKKFENIKDYICVN